MPKITLIQSDTDIRCVEGTEGVSVMQTAIDAGVNGIVAECGGSAMCATCHVYVDPVWLPRLLPPLANELEMLECTAAQRLPESRLSCQIKLSAALDGLVVRIPQRQQ
jgi:ferredoxin, 2Fe-2S